MRNWLFFWAFLFAGTLYGQNYADCIYFWNGFSQEWGYNHRLQRLGSWVQAPKTAQNGCVTTFGHAAASGSGADTAQFRSYATSVAANQVHFGPGKAVFSLEGRENEWLEATAEGEYFDPLLGTPGVQAEVLLSGLDLYTVLPNRANKLREMDIGVDTMWTDSAAHLLHFRFRVRLRLACSSPECPWFSNAVHYQIHLPYVALVGAGFVSHRGEFDRHLRWTRDSLPDSTAVPASLLGAPDYPAAALGIRQLRVRLDGEYHFAHWASFVRPGRYDMAGGRYPFDLGLYFGQWTPGQYDAFRNRYLGKPKLPPKWVVQRKAGEAHMEMEVALLQFSEALCTPVSRDGEINWRTRPGHRREATDSTATWEFLHSEF